MDEKKKNKETKPSPATDEGEKERVAQKYMNGSVELKIYTRRRQKHKSICLKGGVDI